jgi:signal transduction histidine kinase
VLQASRTRERERSVRLTDVDLSEVVSETADIVRKRYHMEEPAIRVSTAEGVLVRGDRAELQTALANLMDNAVKYSGGEPKVAVKLRSTGRRAEVYVKDSGVGIARADLKRVFKRFYRAQSGDASLVKGTGLGLSIVKDIIEKHGGTVGVESNGIGKGSTFYIRLPRV